MIQKRVQIGAFFVLLAVVFVLSLVLWWPFLQLISLAVILAVLFSPIHKKISQRITNPDLAAFVSLLLLILIVILPLALVATFLFKEIISLYNSFKAGDIVIHKQEIIERLPQILQPFAQNIAQDLNATLSRFTENAFRTISQVISNVSEFFISTFLMLFAAFFFLRDGSKIKQIFMDIFPLSQSHENALFARIELAVNGIVKGQLLLALIQGVIATLGYIIFGLPQPFLWGAFTVFTALIPTVGTSIAVIPAAGYLFLTGHTGAAIGMLVWAIFAIGLLDNFLGPKIIGSRTKLHPLLVLFSILGGVKLFGFLGVLLGPIIIAVLDALVEIYRTDLKSYIENR